MRIISLNTNGLRAAERKGAFSWFAAQQADVICIQETKAQTHQLEHDKFHLSGYHRYLKDAVKPGYSGVALYTRHKPKQVIDSLDDGGEFDIEGRYLEAQFDHTAVISVYMPSGSSSEARQAAKFRFLDSFTPHLEKLKACGREVIICGDWNIAHKKMDLKNWRGNQKNSGFLPEERAWLDHVFSTGFTDAFRTVNQNEHEYTWWSNRGQAWANNTGWRIDYQVVSDGLKGQVQQASVYKDQRFSDHAPLVIDYDWQL